MNARCIAPQNFAIHCVLGALLLIVGCGSPHMTATATSSLKLDGHWVLDRQASDDIRARLTPLLEKKERQWRKLERRFEESEGAGRPSRPRTEPSNGEGESLSVQGQAIDNMRWMQGQRQKESKALINAMLPPSELTISQSAQSVKFVSNKDEGTRSFVPGESSSLFGELGAFKVAAGWNKQSFVIESRGTDNGINKVERYTLIDGGARLEEVLELKLPVAGKQMFRLVYKRG